MKKNEFLHNEYGSFDEARFKSFSKWLDKELPTEYIEYLRVFNGGKVLPDCFDINESEGATRISAFYGLHNGPDFNRLDNVNFVFRGRIPRDSIAIASDTVGNQVCIKLEGDQKGDIYFWDHEQESSQEGFVKVSSSLRGFLDKLYEFNFNADEISELLVSKDEAEWKKFVSTHDLEVLDEYGRSLIERAVIKNNLIGVKVLFESGAKLRESHALAKKNRKFFPEFEDMCSFLESLANQ